jgi:Transglutaminase-like superfamily
MELLNPGRRGLFKILVCVTWIALFALLLKRDVFIDTLSTRETLALQEAEGEEYQAVYFRDKKIGFAVSRFSLDREGRQRLQQEATMHLNIAGATQPLFLRLQATVNADNSLHDFDFSFYSPFYRMQAAGRASDNRVSYRLDSGTGIIEDTLTFSEPPIIATPRRGYLLQHSLQAGEKRRIPWFDPLSMTKKESILEYRGQESVFINQRVQKLHHFVESFSGAWINIWLNDEGTVVKEESPAGFVFQKEPKFKALEMSETTPDLLAAVAIQPQGEIGDLDGPEKRYRLTVPEGAILDLNGGRQHLDGGLLILRRETMPSLHADICGDGAASLVATPYLQADHPEVVAMARKIGAEAATPLAKVEKLALWVYSNIDKRPVIGLPDALTTLSNRRGDCNEHAALFAALARAMGIPARIASGVTVQRGAFYYHAWNEVCLDNRWLSVDTTTNQFPADLGHIRLVLGEIQEQLRLSGLLGTLRIEVVDHTSH